jgi:hypothetical protein
VIGEIVAAVTAWSAVVLVVVYDLRKMPSKHDEEQRWYRDRKSNSRQHDPSEATIRALASQIDAIGDELYAQRKQQHHHENRRHFLEKIGVWAAIVAAFLAGLTALIFQGQLNQATADSQAFIFFRNPRYVFADNPQTKIIMFSGEWANSGRTPPSQLKVWRLCDKRPGASIPPDFSKARKIYKGQSLLVGPGSFVTEELTGAMWEGYMKDRSQFIVCYGEAAYLDSSSRSHRTEFCYQSDWINVDGPVPFVFTQCDGRNCADDDCKD